MGKVGVVRVSRGCFAWWCFFFEFFGVGGLACFWGLGRGGFRSFCLLLDGWTPPPFFVLFLSLIRSCCFLHYFLIVVRMEGLCEAFLNAGSSVLFLVHLPSINLAMGCSKFNTKLSGTQRLLDSLIPFFASSTRGFERVIEPLRWRVTADDACFA
ncbi:hypothetical protein B0I37DRAFT_377252 [Chaetomium sp. MPI-CAGE-AT-0009]|nr:hypothetical protein B0I37DRAFT_377252 [Chaetomium sp. MPI-CAGE-AT-0009]